MEFWQLIEKKTERFLIKLGERSQLKHIYTSLPCFALCHVVLRLA